MLLAIVGMQSEAALLPPGVAVLVSGGDTARLRALLAERRAGEDEGVLSFGIAGGLDPDLSPGALIVATAVDGWPADPAWAAALVLATGARPGVLAGADAVVPDAAAKRALQVATGALAVDMESAAAAAFAARLGLPFAALRAVADTATEALPRAAAVGLTPEGRPAPARVLAALLRRPGELPALLRVARRSATALASLRRAVGALGPDLGATGLGSPGLGR